MKPQDHFGRSDLRSAFTVPVTRHLDIRHRSGRVAILGFVGTILLGNVCFVTAAHAGAITNSVWIKDDEDFGYYKTTVGAVAASMVHNPGAIPSPMRRWNITITAITETNAATDTVRAEGDFGHTTAVTGHPDEAPLSRVSDFDVNVDGGAMRNDTDVFNPVLHPQRHNDAHYVELKATAAAGNITGHTLTAVGVHGEDKIRLFDGGQGAIQPGQRPNPGPEQRLNLRRDSFDTLSFFKRIDLNGVSIPLQILDFDITVDFAATSNPVVFDATISGYNFEFAPFALPGFLSGVNRQVLDSSPVCADSDEAPRVAGSICEAESPTAPIALSVRRQPPPPV
jgi:hypothetical protein